jgi:hypothetical protein
VAQARRTADAVRSLGTELQILLDVVVLVGEQVRALPDREGDLASVSALLAAVQAAAPAAMQRDLLHRATGLRRARASVLRVVPPLEQVQQQVTAVLGAPAVGLLAWAWQCRAILGPSSAHLLEGLPPTWRPAAALLLAAGDQTVRASSLVENWHSVLRPHLAVHRTLSTGMLALLAVWHHHRLAPRGVHLGTSPRSRSGIDAPTEWLVALGSPPQAAQSPASAAPSRRDRATAA